LAKLRDLYETPLAALPEASAPDLKNKSFTITAEEIPANGAEGMIFTQGGFTGGWGFYMQQGKLVGEHSYVALDRYRVVSSEPAPTVGLRCPWTSNTMVAAWRRVEPTLLANGRKIGEGRVDKTTPLKYALSEGRTSAKIQGRASISATRHRSNSRGNWRAEARGRRRRACASISNGR